MTVLCKKCGYASSVAPCQGNRLRAWRCMCGGALRHPHKGESVKFLARVVAVRRDEAMPFEVAPGNLTAPGAT